MKRTSVILSAGVVIWMIQDFYKFRKQRILDARSDLRKELDAISTATDRLTARAEQGLYRPTSRQQIKKDLDFEIWLVEHGS